MSIEELTIDGVEVYIERANNSLNLWEAVEVAPKKVEAAPPRILDTDSYSLRARILSVFERFVAAIRDKLDNDSFVQDLLAPADTSASGVKSDEIDSEEQPMRLRVGRVLLADIKIHPFDFMATEHEQTTANTDLRISALHITDANLADVCVLFSLVLVDFPLGH